MIDKKKHKIPFEELVKNVTYHDFGRGIFMGERGEFFKCSKINESEILAWGNTVLLKSRAQYAPEIQYGVVFCTDRLIKTGMKIHELFYKQRLEFGLPPY